MTTTRLSRLSTRLPAEICPAAGFGEVAAAALAAASDTTELLYDLMARKEWSAAVSLLAHALPKPDAVWWACECARVTMRDDEPATNIAVLEAAQEWVTNPSEPSRRAAARAAAAADSRSPCAMAAFSAFFSGGSIAAAGAPELPPPEHLTGTMAATAVMLAVAAGDPEQAEDRYRKFLDGGIQLARE